MSWYSSFVAQFVGNNNKLRVKLHRDAEGDTIARYADRYDFKLAQKFEESGAEDEYDLFIRPEAVIINPGEGRENFQTIPVDVTSILFDGGNSRLMVKPLGTDGELVVALPQTREYDFIRSGDRIQVGWDLNKTICFRRSDWKLYDEE